MIRRAAIALLVAATCATLIVSCVLPGEIREHRSYIESEVHAHPDIEAHTLKVDDFTLHYRAVGNAQSAVALWIHGTPGSWSDIGRLMRNEPFLESVKLVSLDRPGWGDSQYPDRRAVPTFAEHSRLIGPLLKKLRNEHPSLPIIVIGHSWGAPLLPTLALDHPQNIDGLIALAGPFDASITSPRWYNRAASLPGIRTLIGRDLRTSNQEMYALPGELSREAARWSELSKPLWLLHGEADSLVSVAHARFAQAAFGEMLEHVVVLSDEGHLLQIRRTPLIAGCVQAMADRQPDKCAPEPLLR
ncbi:MAG: lysophospholipase [Pseudomonadaceae bacterium]|nr:lysophospholipase [Pseudomonadaceae bacterium]